LGSSVTHAHFLILMLLVGLHCIQHNLQLRPILIRHPFSPVLEVPSFNILERKVFGFMPKIAAAPFTPER
jgi:hypothetical protein